MFSGMGVVLIILRLASLESRHTVRSAMHSCDFFYRCFDRGKVGASTDRHVINFDNFARRGGAIMAIP